MDVPEAEVRVLLVDGDGGRARRGADRLSAAGEAIDLAVATETDPTAALERVEDADCVVSAYDLGDTDGIAFLGSVRARDRDVPFFLFPAEGSEAVASAAASSGVTDYVPRDPEAVVPGPETVDPYARLASRIATVVSQRRVRRDSRAAAARFGALAENIADAVVVVDADSRIQYANPAVERVLGYPPEEVRGESLTVLMPDRFRDRHLTAVADYLADRDRTVDWTGVEFPGLHREGHEVPLSISFGEFEHEGKCFFAGVIRRRE